MVNSPLAAAPGTILAMAQSFYGWQPDAHDPRDLRYAPHPARLRRLPPAVDLRPHLPAPYDQLSLNSCVANAVAAALEFEQMRQGARRVTPSRLFLYYNARALEDVVSLDHGVQIRNGIKAVAKMGACAERQWPYRVHRFAVRPPRESYKDAQRHRALRYFRLRRSLAHLCACLAEGYPFVFGMTVYPGFESARVTRTGAVSLPGLGERRVGGHAVLAVGYSHARRRFLVRNSWGPDWGRGGYFTLPYAYLERPRLAKNFWTIRWAETP
jgi:C1A family cysteine protease